MRRMKGIGLVLAILILAGRVNALPAEAAAKVAPYTILVYMVGSDLESNSGAATDDIIEMAAVGSSKNVNVLIETGGAKQWYLPVISNKVNQRWLVEKDNLKLVNNKLGNRSMGKQSTLQDFLIWGVKNYPAEKFVVILWDHGAGAQGFGYDENNLGDPSLTLKEINGALKAAEATSKKKFEMVGFDACLMANIETATALQDYASYMVASEELEPGHGWDYTSALKALNKKPTATGAEFGKAIADGYKKQAVDAGTDKQITLSVVNLAKVKAVNTALDKFIKKASNDIKDPERITSVSMARSKAEDYGDAGAHGGSTDMADIYDIANNLKSTYPTEASQLMKSIKACITYKITSDAKPNANGLSIYFPCKDKDNFKAVLKAYANTGYTKSYQQFLATYVDKMLADQTPIQLTQADPSAGEYAESLFEIQVAQEDIDSINELYSVLAVPYDEAGNINMFLGMDMDVELDTTTGIVKENFTGLWTTLNGNFVSMFIDEIGEDYVTYTIPAILNGETVDIMALYTVEGGIVMGAWRGIDEITGMPDKEIIEIYVGDIITPLYYYYDSSDDSDGYIEGAAFEVGDQLWLEQTELPEGDYLYGFYLTDIAQNDTYSDFVIFTIKDGMISIAE
ncbi:MAG: clostripain-related cysteine peptidase [Mobilitalea sp.]